MAGSRTARKEFSGLWGRLGALGDPSPVYESLTTAYSQSTRHYHDFKHIAACLAEFDSVRRLCLYPDEVEFALWFHDVVYDTHARDNEARSAELERVTLSKANVAANVIARVEALVLATRHVEVPAENDARVICDIDLAILGKSAKVFDAYERAIRKEYGWVAEADFKPGRRQILGGILARPKLYTTEHFRKKYERKARENLARSVARLSRTP